MLTDAQMTTLAAGIRASSDPTVVAALALRNDVALTDWCNSSSSQDCWREDLGSAELFEATDVAKFDTLNAGKRDAWRLMLDFPPVNTSRNKVRKAIEDVWGATDSVAVLQACVRKATNAEQILGGSSATSNTVTAWKLNVAGPVSLNEVSVALNRNP